MTKIKLSTNDQVLTATVKPPVSSGSRNAVEIEVNFDSNWSAYTKSAIFYTSKDSTVYEKVLDGGTTCRIPHEVLREPCTLYIALRGVSSSGNVKTSARIAYDIVPGSPIIITSAPSEDVYTQLMGKYNDIVNLFSKISAVPVDTPVKFLFSGRFTALITVNAPNGKGYATYLAQGYGASEERLHVTALQTGTLVSYEISSTEEAVIVTAGGTSNVSYGVLMLYGTLPTITY